MKLVHIDSLRGIAILMVVLVHTSQSITGISSGLKYITGYGQMGVQLFFVVSALTLCLSMEYRKEERYKNTNFFIRRFFRIAPLYYCGIFLYAVTSWVISYIKFGQGEFLDQYTLHNITTNIFFLHGFSPSAYNNIVPGGWSIGTEMIFYILFPLIFYFFSWYVSACVNCILLIFFVLVIFLFNAFFILVLSDFYVANNGFYYCNIINQLSVFILGIFLYHLYSVEYHLKWSSIIDLLMFIVMTAVSSLFWYYDWFFSFVFIPFISGVSFIFLHNIFLKKPALNFYLLTRIGQLSFSIYIIHFIFAHQVSRIIDLWLSEFNLSDISKLSVCYSIVIMFSYALAILSERYIEKPGILMGKKLIQLR